MKITKNLPQFENRNVILLVSSKQNGRVLIARDGEVKELLTLNKKRDRYTDREGLFMHSGKGQIYGAGAVYEANDDEIINQFLTELGEAVRKTLREERIDEIILFSPKQLINGVLKAMPADIQKHIHLKIAGNFFQHHPFELLKKVQAAFKDNLAEPLNPEAKKILRKKM